MNHIRQRCADLGLELPAVAPRGLYHSTVRHSDMLYLSGQVSRVENGVIAGPVDGLSSSERIAAARAAALRALAALADALAPGERLRVLKLTVFVMSTPQFQDHGAVADGVSQVLIDVLGEGAVHSRTAVGVASLPSGGAVEFDMICAVSPSQ